MDFNWGLVYIMSITVTRYTSSWPVVSMRQKKPDVERELLHGRLRNRSIVAEYSTFSVTEWLSLIPPEDRWPELKSRTRLLFPVWPWESYPSPLFFCLSMDSHKAELSCVCKAHRELTGVRWSYSWCATGSCCQTSCCVPCTETGCPNASPMHPQEK